MKEVGFFRTFLLAIIVSLLLFELTNSISANHFLALLIYPVIIISTHLLRADHGFLRKLKYAKEIILAGEYNLLVLPLSLFLLYNQLWLAVFFGHLLIMLIIHLPFTGNKKRETRDSRFVSWIPVNLFEWRSYFRQRWLFLLICFVFTALLSPNALAMSLAILVLGSIFSEAFAYLESKELIDAYPVSSHFLWSKVKDHSVFIHLLFLPVYSLFLFFHPNLWYILVLLLAIIECSICFCLVYKYSRFGVSKSEVHNQIPFIIFYISTILFLPIGITFIYYHWKKATKVLSKYAKD
jgi:hypothetical protein